MAESDQPKGGWIDPHGFEHGTVDVFISSSHDPRDRASIIKVAEVLIDHGLTVFSSAATAEIPAGVDYQSVVRHYLDKSKVILVCWSNKATTSDWVNAEAEFGRAAGRLVACKISACSPLPPFNTFQFEDISDWKGGTAHHGVHRLVRLLEQRTRGGTTEFDLSVKPSKRPVGGWWSALFGKR